LAECHPMPAVTGRLCPHPCESECSRNAVDTPVNINGLEQFLGDHLLSTVAEATPGGPAGSATAPQGEGRVAVIGSGPAGLSAAYFLAREGFAVTVFEKDARPGGLLRTAVPAFRLPEGVLDAQIAGYRALGVEFRTGVQIGRDVTLESLHVGGFDAVITATGAARPMKLSVAGGDADGVVSAIDFLAAAKKGGLSCRGATVAVVGGGSVAMDAARTAVRLGAGEVVVVCLERLERGIKDSMPALTEEIDQAQAEGVKLLPSRGVDSFVVDDGRVRGIRCVECLSVRDEKGLFAPVYGDCLLPQTVPADTVVLAMGQVPDETLVPAGMVTDARGRIKVVEETLCAGPGLFAAGDAVSGASTVVEALASGRRAAEAAARYLRRGSPEATGVADSVAAEPPPRDKIETLRRMERPVRTADERRKDMLEVTGGLPAAEAQREAERCLTCGSRSKIAYLDDCQVCRLCQRYCPADAIEVTDGALLGSLHGWNVVELGRR
jgi:NADPH-dependent glutamate synthase beta subunit-like oxidoreductase